MMHMKKGKRKEAGNKKKKTEEGRRGLWWIRLKWRHITTQWSNQSLKPTPYLEIVPSFNNSRSICFSLYRKILLNLTVVLSLILTLLSEVYLSGNISLQ